MSDGSSLSHDPVTITKLPRLALYVWIEGHEFEPVPIGEKFQPCVVCKSASLSGGQKERLAIAVATLVHTGEFCIGTAVEGMESQHHEY